MTEPRRVSLIWIILLALVLVLIVFNVSYGSDHYDDSDDTVSTETIVKGNRGISVSGSDMEINECVSSFSWLFGIVQEVRTNPLCVAKQLEAEGKYKAAAELRCSVRRVRTAYGSMEKCIDAVIFIPPPEPEPVPVNNDEVDERYVQQQEEIEYLREENASIVGQIEQITQQMERAPSGQQQAQQQIDSAAQRRAKSRAAYEEALAKGSEQ